MQGTWWKVGNESSIKSFSDSLIPRRITFDPITRPFEDMAIIFILVEYMISK